MAQETTTRLGLCILVIVPVLLPQRGAFCAEPITIRCVNDSSLAITKKIIAKLGNSNPKLAQRIDAASWGYGAFHRFADGECHILVHRRFPTPAEQKYIGWHLKGGLPKEYVLGQHRVLVIVNVANGISKISTGQIFKILAAGKEPPNWSDLGGTSTSKVRCYGESSKARSYVILREKCLRQESKGEVSYREIRKDIRQGADANEVIKLVRQDRLGIGFISDPGGAIKGVKVLSLVADNGAGVLPKPGPVIQRNYTLCEWLLLYLHPQAPSDARDFCEFATTTGTAVISPEFCLTTPHIIESAKRAARGKLVRAGKGWKIRAMGCPAAAKLLSGLAAEFVEAKKAVQMRYVSVSSDVAAVGYFVHGKELLVLNGKPSERAMKIHGKKWEEAMPVPFEIAGRGVAIIVHSLNRIESLTLDQVRAVFAGKVTDWKILGGGTGFQPVAKAQPRKADPLKIHRYGLRRPDLAVDLFHEKVLASHLCGAINRKKGTAAVLSALSIDPEGIAFVNFADIPAEPDKSSIKVLAIGRGDKAVRPTAQTIMSGDYPFSRRLHLYVSPKASDTTKDFVKFVLSGNCGEAFGKQGLVPAQVHPPTTQPEQTGTVRCAGINRHGVEDLPLRGERVLRGRQ